VSVTDGVTLHRESVVVDLHVHGPGFVPKPFRSAWKALTPKAPPEAGFDALRAGAVDAVVAKAVGDAVVTRWYLRRTPWEAVEAQLALIEAQAAAAGATLVTTADDVAAAHARRTPAVILGVEGADAIAPDIDRVDAWYRRGVRVVVLVHLKDNALGTTCLPWQQYAGPVPVRRSTAPGLTSMGAAAVRRMNALGIAVDVAHADGATLRGVLDVAVAPVLSSHSGARALQDFPRYLTDDELRGIASTGGVVGLWPYRSRRWGVSTVDELVAHARHIADAVGVEHLALGTDMNGVPAVMHGYRDVTDLHAVTSALLAAGFTAGEVQAVIGGNAVRFLRAVESAASASAA
jgi:membrane dipeptidase